MRTALLALLVMVTSCTSAQRAGTSPAFLIIDSLEAASGAAPSTFGGTLASDVVTVVTRRVDGTDVRQPTVFEDVARVELSLALRDPGSGTTATQPTSANFITVTRYHVRFIRADGRNAPGVDVPYAFDGAFTITVGGERRPATLVLVRAQAKQEAPLSALGGGAGPGVISTIAEITFYGADQAGRAVNVVGRIGVNFADWSDPED
ncbi:MAG TPA: hypothetical protein VES67_04345 [Vicinamibacterales bacterium]|nr:hypothetical protein [Vicinamibacterales bacterium]